MPDAAAPTVNDVARLAGVSRQTVSNVFNAPARVAGPTEARVRAAIDELGYVPNRSARSLRTRSSRLFAVRMERPHEGNVGPYRDRFLGALTTAAGAYNHNVLLFSRDRDQGMLDGYEELLRSTGIDAFVLMDTHLDDPRPAALTTMGATFISFGRPWGEPDGTHPWVDVDGAAGTRQATTHLVQQRRRRIGFLGWPRDSEAGTDRLRGWRESLEDHGLDAGEDHVARALETFDDAAAAAGPLLDAGHDAVVCASDTLASGVYRAAADRHLEVGRDVAVVGFDDSPTASVLHPAMSSVHQPLEQIATSVVDMLSQVLEGHPAPAPRLLAPTLVIRASSTPAPPAPAESR